MNHNNYSEFKYVAVRSGMKYWQIAEAANDLLPPEQHLTENAIARLATNRKVPTVQQAQILATALSSTVEDIFPGLESEGAR